MFDVRGKQNFIFRTNRLKEIVGGSWIIRDVFCDYLYPTAEMIGGGKGIYGIRKENGRYIDLELPPFSKEAFEQHISEGYIGEVVYNGGGNFLMLIRDEDTFRKLNYAFTKTVMEAIGTLRVLATCIDHVNFDDYMGDRSRLYAKHRINEAQESVSAPWSCLPIVLVDRKTSMPIVRVQRENGEELELSKESDAKRRKYRDEIMRIRREMELHPEKLNEADRYMALNGDELDRLVEKKGEDSQLAVIYIDGNSMGAKVEAVTEHAKTYGDCIRVLRDFSKEIQGTYVEQGIQNALENIRQEGKESYRVVIYAGDEINFIVKAKDAFGCADRYLEYLRTQSNASACAGIAVFHSHAPYASAYRIAEECCESGKQAMKAAGITTASLIDFHLCQGAIDNSLEKIREKENGDICSRPWLIWADEAEASKAADIQNITEIRRLQKLFNQLGRTNVKGLAEAAKTGNDELGTELNRIWSHASSAVRTENKETWQWLLKELDNTKRRSLVYDLSITYDLWFSKGEEEKR